MRAICRLAYASQSRTFTHITTPKNETLLPAIPRESSIYYSFKNRKGGESENMKEFERFFPDVKISFQPVCVCVQHIYSSVLISNSFIDPTNFICVFLEKEKMTEATTGTVHGKQIELMWTRRREQSIPPLARGNQKRNSPIPIASTTQTMDDDMVQIRARLPSPSASVLSIPIAIALFVIYKKWARRRDDVNDVSSINRLIKTGQHKWRRPMPKPLLRMGLTSYFS